MWVRLLADHTFTPPEERRISIAYKAGRAYSVKRAWGEAMVELGVAAPVNAPRRKAAT